MSEHKTNALNKIIDDLSNFEINLTTYYNELEVRSFYDIELTAKLQCFRSFCVTNGWSNLTSQIDSFLPINGNAHVILISLKGYIIPEANDLMQTSSLEQQNSISWFWKLIHPKISEIAQQRFSSGFYGDAVESSFKELNNCIKQIVINKGGPELDGAPLMNKAFSPQNPFIKLTNLNSESGKNEQQGYMLIMAGAMTGIRNPKAHANLNPDKLKTMHLISLASLLMFKIDERLEPK